ncbi:MAG TPA: hypothetical protein VLX91_06415 [Candidatus Acidoferrales bacterium]|nr:hypothetical protein [Candidatus Acidoferrales bacterium]
MFIEANDEREKGCAVKASGYLESASAMLVCTFLFGCGGTKIVDAGSNSGRIIYSNSF